MERRECGEMTESKSIFIRVVWLAGGMLLAKLLDNNGIHVREGKRSYHIAFFDLNRQEDVSDANDFR